MPFQPALGLTIAMPGLEPMTVMLSRLKTDITDWRPFWSQRFAPLFYRTMLEEFVTEGGATGERWAPLTPAYAAWKQRHVGASGYGILQRGGALKASLIGMNGPDAVFNASEQSLEVGTSVPYAMYHQMGTRRMVARPPLRLDRATVTRLGQMLQEYVQAAWAARQAELGSLPASA